MASEADTDQLLSLGIELRNPFVTVLADLAGEVRNARDQNHDHQRNEQHQPCVDRPTSPNTSSRTPTSPGSRFDATPTCSAKPGDSPTGQLRHAPPQRHRPASRPQQWGHAASPALRTRGHRPTLTSRHRTHTLAAGRHLVRANRTNPCNRRCHPVAPTCLRVRRSARRTSGRGADRALRNDARPSPRNPSTAQ